MKVIIIGAGTGGLALAHGLKRAGIAVAVCERDRTPRDSRGGYRVGISPGGSRALKACVPPEVYDLFVATCARAPDYFTFYDQRLHELFSLDIAAGPRESDNAERNIVRKTLRRVLLQGLEAEVGFGKTFVDYFVKGGQVTARFEDGSRVTGDVLVGADGANSRVRRQRLPHARHEDTGLVSVGGHMPMTAETRALLTPKMLSGMSMLIAPKGFGAIIHSLEFTPARNDPDVLRRWPDFADAVARDSIGWGLWGARRHFPKDPAAIPVDEIANLALEATRDWHPHFRELIRRTDPLTLQALNIRTSIPVAPWESSNVTLLGDAIHTMTPGRGAGANTALRDAALLCRMLQEAACGRAGLVPALAAYEKEMLRYSTGAVLASRKGMTANGAIHKPVIGDLQFAATKAMMRTINAIPPLKRRISDRIRRVRGEN
jgi:2-polyprenyl-6-methoxyphenol hydroxylase-like FAD-dependent oxidoreductase